MKKNFVLVIIALFYIAIPILIMFSKDLFSYKFYLLIILSLLLFIIAKIFKIKNKHLGITKSNLKISILKIFPITLLCLCLSFLLPVLHVFFRINSIQTFFKALVQEENLHPNLFLLIL